MLFEMLTGDFLFDPKKQENIPKSEDQLALMMELLNTFPKNYTLVGTNTRKYINQHGLLKHFDPKLRFMTLKNILIRNHSVKVEEAQALADFLMPMLEIYPEKRASAFEMLQHPWLKRTSQDFFMTQEEIDDFNNSK